MNGSCIVFTPVVKHVSFTQAKPLCILFTLILILTFEQNTHVSLISLRIKKKRSSHRFLVVLTLPQCLVGLCFGLQICTQELSQSFFNKETKKAHFNDSAIH